jgi:cation:H+ antiporter
MEAWLHQLFVVFPLWLLFLIIALLIVVLGKGADLLVDEAVSISLRWGVPKILIGATIVSLGTTLPEAAVSVFAAIKGSPGLALGNAVGSIICDTGLILGLAAIISPLPLIPSVVNRQGWIQLGAGALLILACLPYLSLSTTFSQGGRLPQYMGIIFLVLLVLYIWKSLTWVKRGQTREDPFDTVLPIDAAGNVWILVKLGLGIFMVVASSRLLIPAVQEAAVRLHVPDSIIAATLVAFGTSLPELVTALTAVKKGHGELAVGNIIGADILNVLFVSGAAAAVTPGGLQAEADFFRFLFPAMLLILIIFRLGIFIFRDRLKRPFGFLLLGIYVIVTIIGYTR